MDIEAIERVVISHNHWDHSGGLWGLLNINKNIEVFVCSDFAGEFKDKLVFCDLREYLYDWAF